MQLVIRDANQGPFLTQVLRFGRDNERLSEQQLAAIKGKAVLMSLKFADKYYNKYKMHLLEQAAHDVIGVVSLGLQELSPVSYTHLDVYKRQAPVTVKMS